MRYFIISILLSIYGLGFNYHLQPFQVTKDVACFLGLNEKVQEINGGRVINTCFITTSQGYVVIDSGPTYSYAQQAYQVMQSKKRLPVKYVINTAAGELHVLGNEFYKEQGAILIGPSSYKKLLEQEEQLSLFEKISNAIFFNTRLTPLDRYEDNETQLLVGNTPIKIKNFEGGSSQNLAVYLPKSATIFVGNYVSSRRVPALQGHRSLAHWLTALEKIEALPWKHLIAAHGVTLNRKALISTRNYLTTLKKRVLEAIEQKENKQKALKEVELTAYEGLAFYDELHPYNIEQAYDELKAQQPPNDDQMNILLALSTIETEQILKEHTTNSIDITEKVIPLPTNQTPNPSPPPTPDRNHTLYLTQPPPKLPPPSVLPMIEYIGFEQAKKEAIQEQKYLLIKVEATNCHPCQELDQLLESNNHIKQMIHDHTKAVKINTDYDAVPLGLSNRGTPTIFLIKPDEERVVMKLEGEAAIKELEDSLKSLVEEDSPYISQIDPPTTQQGIVTILTQAHLLAPRADHLSHRL